VHYSKLPFGEVHEITTYDKNTRRREVATIVRHSNFSDNIKKIDNKKKKNIYKTLVFDSDKSEWYVVEKIKYQKSKVVLWETKFNKEHNMYFTTKITTTFNLTANWR
jgi:hypothetical protein